MVKISENEERKIEDRLIKIEGAIHSIFKTFEHYNNAISRMQIFIFLQNCEDPEMMKMFLKLFAKKAISEKPVNHVNQGVNHE